MTGTGGAAGMGGTGGMAGDTSTGGVGGMAGAGGSAGMAGSGGTGGTGGTGSAVDDPKLDCFDPTDPSTSTFKCVLHEGEPRCLNACVRDQDCRNGRVCLTTCTQRLTDCRRQSCARQTVSATREKTRRTTSAFSATRATAR